MFEANLVYTASSRSGLHSETLSQTFPHHNMILSTHFSSGSQWMVESLDGVLGSRVVYSEMEAPRHCRGTSWDEFETWAIWGPVAETVKETVTH